jgi:hypothetical protein
MCRKRSVKYSRLRRGLIFDDVVLRLFRTSLGRFELSKLLNVHRLDPDCRADERGISTQALKNCIEHSGGQRTIYSRTLLIGESDKCDLCYLRKVPFHLLPRSNADSSLIADATNQCFTKVVAGRQQHQKTHHPSPDHPDYSHALVSRFPVDSDL